MKKKLLALAACIAASAPSISIADVLPESLVGLNLGEIRASSFLNQPFKGVIPFLFTSYENSKNLKVALAPESIFNKIGAEKHPILNSLNFQIAKQNNKAVILISSSQPIQLPFVNFVLEIQGPEGVVYQDYTVLLDPESKQETTLTADYIAVNELDAEVASLEPTLKDSSVTALLELNGSKLLANLSSNTAASKTVSANASSKNNRVSKVAISSSQNIKYRVKAGDSLSKIAQNQDVNNAALSTMSRLIYQKNPKAFIRGDINKIKKGALLNLPTAAEINNYEIARSNKKTNTTKNIPEAIFSSSDIKLQSDKTYKVAKGENLSVITKKFTTKDISFTKMMNAIHRNNPNAFINNSKNKIKTGAELNIPVIAVSKYKPTSKQTVAVNVNESVKSEEAEGIELGVNLNQYQIKQGDNLSIITKKVGYKEVPFAKMLKAIYVQNPEAFVDGKMAELVIGSVITVPPLSSFSNTEVVSKSTNALKNKNSIADSTKINVNKNTATSDLSKRIRELRKELQQSKDDLSELKQRLSDKELLLQQKNIQLESLTASINKSDVNATPKLLPVAVAAVETVAVKNISKPQPRDSYEPISKAEMAKLERNLIAKKQNTQKQIEKTEVLNAEAATFAFNDGNFNSIKADEIKNSLKEFISKNYPYLTIALLLGLLLIRYRRELYQYTYSAISYDQPTYYPLPDADTYELKEKNINYHDPKMDEESYEFFGSTAEEKEDADDEIEDSLDKIVIDPTLVEATEEILVATDVEDDDLVLDDTLDAELKEQDNSKQIEHCEHLVTELFEDLNSDKNSGDETEWNNIEKVCDSYIEKIKDSESVATKAEDGKLIDGVTDFNHMMSDLLESLDKVDKSVKRYNIADQDFPDLLVKAEEKLKNQDKNCKTSKT